MLTGLGKRLLCRGVLPPPLAVALTLAELATVVLTAVEALAGDDEDD